MRRVICIFSLCYAIVVVAQASSLPKAKQPGSFGSDVVQAVLNDLRNACIFSDDNLFLRRLAYVETKDGADGKTYRRAYHGGIWQVDELRFRMTQMPGPPLEDIRKTTLNKLAIDWSKVTWSDLRKPLYSGLAAALYEVLITKGKPRVISTNVDEQAHYWVATYRNTNTSQEFVSAVQNMQQGCTTDYKLDLLFILESSSRMSSTDFNKVKNFTKRIVDSLQIAPDQVRVAVESYSSQAKLDFPLDKHKNNASVLTAIDNVAYTPGSMNTAAALKLATGTVFAQSNGTRQDAAKVIVLVAGDKPDDVIEMMKAAMAVKTQRIIIYTVAVGHNVNVMAYQQVASLPPCSHAFNITTYDELHTLKLPLIHTQCIVPMVLQPGEYNYPCGFDVILQVEGGTHGSAIEVSITKGEAKAYSSFNTSYPNATNHDDSKNVTSTKTTTFSIPANKNISLSLRTETSQGLTCSGSFKVLVDTAASNQSDCRKTKADVVILLDAGETKTSVEFNQMLDFARKFVSQFDVGADKTHIGLVDFAGNASNQFWLSDYKTKGEVLNAFRNIQRYGKSADLSSALAFAREHSFTPHHGMRMGVDKIILLVTESTSGNPAAMRREAELLHNEGIRIVVVDIGTNFDKATLDMLTSWRHHVEHINDFSDLDTVFDNVTEVACAKVNLVCEELGLRKNCSIEDLVRIIGPKFGAALVPGHGYIVSNPCNMSAMFPGMPQIKRFPHPTDMDKFILCEHQTPLIVLCPSNTVYDGAKETCVPAPATTGATTAQPLNSGMTPVSSATGSTRQPISILATLCSPSNIVNNSMIHPYPADSHKYIRCSSMPYTGTVLSCPPHHIFLDFVGQCGNEFVVMENGLLNKTYTNPCTKVGETFSQPDPTKYVICDKDGTAELKTCPPSLRFSTFLHACDY